MRKTLRREMRVWKVVLPIMLAYLILSQIVGWLQDHSRFVSDVTFHTPFYNVEIDRVLVDGRKMTLWGSLNKRRCVKVGQAAYVEKGDMRLPAMFDASEEPEGTPENRPASDDPLPFGPWHITSPVGFPDRAMMYVYHQCPEPEGVVSNLVLDVPWASQE